MKKVVFIGSFIVICIVAFFIITSLKGSKNTFVDWGITSYPEWNGGKKLPNTETNLGFSSFSISPDGQWLTYEQPGSNPFNVTFVLFDIVSHDIFTTEVGESAKPYWENVGGNPCWDANNMLYLSTPGIGLYYLSLGTSPYTWEKSTDEDKIDYYYQCPEKSLTGENTRFVSINQKSNKEVVLSWLNNQTNILAIHKASPLVERVAIEEVAISPDLNKVAYIECGRRGFAAPCGGYVISKDGTNRLFLGSPIYKIVWDQSGDRVFATAKSANGQNAIFKWTVPF